MNKTETFKKVFIKTASDLPEAGFHSAHLINRPEYEYQMTQIGNADYSKKYWLDRVDWYLQPIEQPVQEETQISDIENCVQSFIRTNHLSKKWDKFRDEWLKEEQPEPLPAGKEIKSAREYFLKECNVTIPYDVYSLPAHELFQWMKEYADYVLEYSRQQGDTITTHDLREIDENWNM